MDEVKADIRCHLVEVVTIWKSLDFRPSRIQRINISERNTVSTIFNTYIIWNVFLGIWDTHFGGSQDFFSHGSLFDEVTSDTRCHLIEMVVVWKSLGFHQSRIQWLDIENIVQRFNHKHNFLFVDKIVEIHFVGSQCFSHGNNFDDVTARIRCHLIEVVTVRAVWTFEYNEVNAVKSYTMLHNRLWKSRLFHMITL